MADPNARRKPQRIVIVLEDQGTTGKVLVRVDPDLPSWMPGIQREPRSATGAQALAMLGLAAMRKGFNPQHRDRGSIILPGDGLTPV